MIFQDGYYLLLIENERIIDFDGAHRDKSGVARSLYLYRQLGLLKKCRQYIMCQVSARKTHGKGLALTELESVLFGNAESLNYLINSRQLPKPSDKGINKNLLEVCQNSLKPYRIPA